LIKGEKESILIGMNPSVSVAGAVFSPDRSSVLLIQRRDVPVWVLPGGGIDPGETPEEAVLREILEETGFTVKAERLVGHYIPINRLAKPTDLFECSIVKGQASLSSETRGIAFFPVKALPKLLPPPYPEWISDARQIAPAVCKKLECVNYKTLTISALKHPILVLRFLLARIGLRINY
jgi:8-oxo-dGTP pyrophosphatase MutT (NUDIX family)